MIAQVQPVILDDMYGNYEFDVKLSNIRIENIHNSVQPLSTQLMLLQNNGQIIQWILITYKNMNTCIVLSYISVYESN